MMDERMREICNGVLAMVGELKACKELLDQLPKTADGVVFRAGIFVYCPRGHKHEVHKSDPIGGRIYCCTGDCWSDGCQSDDGSGTHYDAHQCRAMPMPEIRWASHCEIFAQSAGNIWVRFVGADGIYRWLHPTENRWVEEPEQVNIPNFPNYATARAAANASPEPPTWAEVRANKEHT